MSKEKHGTASSLKEGQLAEFVGAGTKALILISAKLGPRLTHIWANNGKAMEHAFLSVFASPPPGFLKRITDKPLILDSTDGSEILPDADVFARILCDLDIGEAGAATEATPVHVYEIVNDATFKQMFGSLNADVDKVCLTQAQIKGFIKKHHQWLRRYDCSTLFLFKSHGKFFVAQVCISSSGKLALDAYWLENLHLWDAECCHRLVAPQLN